MKAFGLSDKGRYRAENQDSYRIRALGEAVVAVVCDGMGGAAAGLLASDMAAEEFLDRACAGLEGGGEAAPGEALRAAAEAANRRVFDFSCGADEYYGMGTTLVGGYFRPDGATLVNIGDSRAYRIADEGIEQLTRDHSLVQQLVDSGDLTPEQARRHPQRNIITRAVGTEESVPGDVFDLPAREGDVFLLCTDGLSGALEDGQLRRLALAAAGPEEVCSSLVTAALEGGARDNVTAVVIDMRKGDGDGE